MRMPSRPVGGVSEGYLFCYAVTASISGVNSTYSCLLANLVMSLFGIGGEGEGGGKRVSADLIPGVVAFTVSLPDITRYAHDPRSTTLAQAVGLPVCLTMSKSHPIPILLIPSLSFDTDNLAF